METLQKQYDKVALIVASVIAIAFAVILILKALSFGEQFEEKQVEQSEEMGETGTTVINYYINKLDEDQEWTRPENGGIEIPLTVSLPIVEMSGGKGDIVNMADPASEPIRTATNPREDAEVAVPNRWLWENNLDYTKTDVLSFDPDGDGFSNLDEYLGQTDPKDPEQFPPFYTKLFLKERGEDKYVLRFSAAINPQYQVVRIFPEKNRSWFKAIGESFPDSDADPAKGRFTIVAVDQKTDQRGLDASVLMVRDNVRTDNNPFALPLREETNRPIYWANFVNEFKADSPEPFRVDKGETFSFANDPDTVYTLKEVEESSATISFIPAGKASAEEVTIPLDK
ncbi:hypothetical protein OAF27_01745 [Verrucomicrobiales bacterium]|nr:hypothetical protein [Verrucomicrobiales bacterium]